MTLHRIFPVLLSLLLIASACNPVHEKVVQSYPNGKPMLVFLQRGNDKEAVRIAERMYYDNGQLQFEKTFSGKPEQPNGLWRYYFDNGQLFASADFSRKHDYGEGWVFYNRNGGPYYDGKLDSVFVTDMGMFGTPSTVVFCSGPHQDVIQFYSNYTVRSTERLTYGLRNGRVMFYFPNGKPQVEADFVNGEKEGPYTVYRDNGIPIYQGYYHQGKRAGHWEFYDSVGNLRDTLFYSAN